MKNDNHLVIMGGAFDPPHLGHSMVISIALSKLDCSELWVLPCWKSAFGKQMSSFANRMKVCEKAFLPVLRIFNKNIVFCNFFLLFSEWASYILV
jgi:nicotinate-nucleotide adenylyltransferase